MYKPFENKRIIITGASSGIGKEMALQLSQQSARLTLAARSVDRLAEVAHLCQENGAQAIYVQTDVSDATQCKNLIQTSVNKFGGIDLLVNNAGYTMWAKFEDMLDLKIGEKLFQVKFFGSVNCTHAALPFLKTSKGQILTISSLTGKIGVPSRTYYSAANHALAGFFDALRAELSGTGVSITIVYPGFIATSIRERAIGNDGSPRGESHIVESQAMPVDICVRQILEATSLKKRELLLTWKDKLGTWLKLFSPPLVDMIARKETGFEKLSNS
ncbi:Short chain dehydrogenase [Candidatus Magnetomorum sp. HK-1]|nr:Short chain dehydrogenase [Candidatus Magnetomorum sp. HK-1]